MKKSITYTISLFAIVVAITIGYLNYSQNKKNIELNSYPSVSITNITPDDIIELEDYKTTLNIDTTYTGNLTQVKVFLDYFIFPMRIEAGQELDLCKMDNKFKEDYIFDVLDKGHPISFEIDIKDMSNMIKKIREEAYDDKSLNSVVRIKIVYNREIDSKEFEYTKIFSMGTSYVLFDLDTYRPPVFIGGLTQINSSEIKEKIKSAEWGSGNCPVYNINTGKHEILDPDKLK